MDKQLFFLKEVTNLAKELGVDFAVGATRDVQGAVDSVVSLRCNYDSMLSILCGLASATAEFHEHLTTESVLIDAIEMHSNQSRKV